MQDEGKETWNNMQADNEGAETLQQQESVLNEGVLPGPSISNWRKVAPNSLTALANAVGLSAMVLGMEGKFDIAILCILGAGLLDGLDGPVARALNGTSRFGAEFDSLSDYVNFGVSPGVLLYYWSLQNQDWIGWGICLLYIICMGCRLARFNAGVDFNASKVTRSFFMGVPAPAGAMLVVFPIVCHYQLKDIFPISTFKNPYFVMPYTSFVAFLLVSRLPTFSTKGINGTVIGKMNAVKVIGFIAVAVFFVVAATTKPWLVLILIQIGYILSFPVSYLTFKKWTAKEQREIKQATTNPGKSTKPKGN